MYCPGSSIRHSLLLLRLLLLLLLLTRPADRALPHPALPIALGAVPAVLLSHPTGTPLVQLVFRSDADGESKERERERERERARETERERERETKTDRCQGDEGPHVADRSDKVFNYLSIPQHDGTAGKNETDETTTRTETRDRGRETTTDRQRERE